MMINGINTHGITTTTGFMGTRSALRKSVRAAKPAARMTTQANLYVPNM